MINMTLVKSKIIFTNDELEKFKKDPLRNPKTGRIISTRGRIYKMLREQLLDKEQNNTDKNNNISPKLIIKKLKDKPLK